MPVGKLYRHDKLLGEVEYALQTEDPHGWWGELIFVEYCKAEDGGGYIMEFADSRRGACALRKRINKAVHGIPPRYYYHFKGTGLIEPHA